MEKAARKIKLIKETQGHKKLKQYTEDLIRNEHFMKEARELYSAYNKKLEDTHNDISALLQEYRKLDRKSKKYLKINYAELDKATKKMAEKYGLDMDLLRPVLFNFVFPNREALSKNETIRDNIFFGDAFDMCCLVDNNDEQINPVFPPLPLALDSRKQDHLRAFPISIDIHKFASKRDVLDFIEKRWPIISDILGIYRDYENKRFRERKIERKISDFIWEKRNLSLNDIKRELDEKFPSNKLLYYEIGKLISVEKRRRLGKLT